MKKIFLISFLAASVNLLWSQANNSVEAATNNKLTKGNAPVGPSKPLILGYEVIDGDTVLKVDMPVVVVRDLRVFSNKADQRKYDRLVNDVKKVYPYAKKSAEVWKLHNFLSQSMNDKDRKSYMKNLEDSLTSSLGNKIKGLNKRQGVVLLKLIDRESNISTFDMLKDIKGGFKTFFYQTTAKMFGYNLKTKFDPVNNDTDKYIDEIVFMIESGRI